MRLKEAYNNTIAQLRHIYSADEAIVITEWLFESVVSAKRSAIIQDPQKTIETSIVHNLNIKLTELLQHRPIQYVLGEAWFYSLKLKVNEHVLIPRPETEELVDLIIKNKRTKTANPLQILDIGTGSGCIPIALKKNIPGTLITAIDFSEAALAVAKANAIAHQAAISFLQLDFLNEDMWQQLPMFDIIVSNPPYIPFNEKERMSKNVTDYEPDSALFVPDNDPLLFYKKIAAFGKNHLNKDGRIYVETHENHAKETAELFSISYKNVAVIKDLFGKERIVTAS